MRTFKKKNFPLLDFETVCGVCFCLILTSCTNSLFRSNPNTIISATASPTASPSGGSSSVDKHVIGTVTIASPAGAGAATPPTTTIYFDTTKSTASISTHCSIAGNASQTAKACLCQFSWIEINPNGGTSSSVQRTFQTSVTQVQAASLTCPAPDVYTNEITNGTQIKINVIGAANNPDIGAFSTNSYSYTKNTTATSGSFADSTGQIYDNILHYGCYEKFKRGMTIQSKSDIKTNSVTQRTKTVYFATRFCVAKGGGGGAGSQGCSNIPPAEYSSQAHYYNLYIRNSEQGDINLFNDSHVCPTVKETLNTNNTVGTQNQVWPLDANFALSLGKTTTFSKGVEAFTKLNVGSDPTAANSGCTAPAAGAGGGAAGGGASFSGFIRSCLGFAAKLNPDGTCPYFKDSKGQIRFTYRLRRYVAIYPRVFDTDGKVFAGSPQGLDTIYVLDRPVKASANTDPLKPFTMKGPKPCPFAFFDKKGLTSNGTPIYVGTNNVGWAGKNIDGIEFPNVDNEKSGSCSAALPVIDPDKTSFSIRTVNINHTNSNFRHVYIRPVQPFTPHYEEDTSFEACAPQASPFKDAPLHFARDPISKNVSWCVESYPTQNQFIKSIDPPLFPSNDPTIPTGAISNYTSHTVRNSSSSDCTATIPSIPTTKYSYSFSAGTQYARHLGTTTLPWESNLSTANKTCDRTSVDKDLAWPQYPLLSPTDDLESGIKTDSSYNCTVTFDNGGTKTNKYTPSSGCCDKSSVFVTTDPATPTSAHLEPDVPCKTPTY